jgi:hypothetical protein
MSHLIYQGRQMGIATAARKCDRCARRGECFYVVAPVDERRMGDNKELSLCLENCWPDFLAALAARSEMP